MAINNKPKTLKKVKQSFTPLLIASMHCPPGKSQFLYWDLETSNFGVRVTASGNKSFIFEASLQNKSIRITISNVKDISLEEARKQANKLKSLIRMGVDPRKVQNKRTAQWASASDLTTKNKLKNETLKSVWLQYAEAHHQPEIAIKPWTNRRYHQHLSLIETVLSPLAVVKMADLSVAHIKAWANDLKDVSDSHLRFNAKLCLDFLSWCHEHETYQHAVPKSMLTQMQQWVLTLNDHTKAKTLAPEQLKSWFSAIHTIPDLTVQSYLKTLLLTGRHAQEILSLKWKDIDFKQKTITLKNNLGTYTQVPLSKMVAQLLNALPQPSEYVFDALVNPTKNQKTAEQLHKKTCQTAGIKLSIDDLFNSFTLFSEWVETPASLTAQLQGFEIKNSVMPDIVRPLPVLQLWQQKIEDWILRHST